LIRLLLRLFGITDFEVCASCETLKRQLAFEREEKNRLTEVLLEIMKPKVVEAPAVEINPVQQNAALFSRRRAFLEAKDREEAKILKQSQHLAKPDVVKSPATSVSIEALEKELGVEEKEA
jgi:hypothetical protein